MSLIDKLSALTGPDREVDCKIALAAGWDVEHMSAALPDLVAKFGEAWLFETVTEYNSIYNKLPAYTASIDAAMTLVPEGHSWMLSVGGCSIAQVTDCTGDACTVPPDYDGQAPTPAIALCISALKATHTAEGQPNDR